MPETVEKGTAILLVTCPDRKGLVAKIAEFIYAHTMPTSCTLMNIPTLVRICS